MASKGRELWEKYKKERRSPLGEERIATGSNAALAMTGRGHDAETGVTSTGNTARDKWNQLKVNRTLPKAAAAQERARTVYSPQTGAFPAQQLLAQKDRQVAAYMAQDIEDPAGAEERAEARKYRQLVYTDTDALDQEILDLEQQRGSYDDAFLTWASGYEMNPGAWDPEEFADNIARYQQLKDTHGSITALDQQITSKKKTRRDAEKAQEEHAAYVQQLRFQQKYAGMSYSQLQQAMAGLDKTSDEYKWLSQYAPTVMTAQDHRDVFSQAQADRAALDAEREIYDDAFFTWATGYEMNPGAWDPEEFADNIAKYEQLKKTHGSIGAAAAHYDREEQQLNDKWWMLERNAKYLSLPGKADFAENSKPGTKKTEGLGIGWGDKYLGVGDPKYNYINDLDGTRAKYKESEENDGARDPYTVYQHMTADEIASYNYLYNTEGKDAAEEYLEWLSYSLNQREQTKKAEQWAALAKESPFWSSAASVPLNLMGGAGYMDVALQMLKNKFSGENKPIDYNRPAMGASVGASTIRQTVSQDIADKYGMIEMDEKRHPVLSKIFNGKSFGDVYQLGMSMADSGAVALLSPVLGSAGVALLGGSAATQGMLDAVENGATDEQALTMGLLNGAAEIVFENISLKSLLNGPADSLIKTILNQGFEEGREELLTSLANNLADAVIMAEKSGYTQKVEQYRAQGLTEGQAVAKALTDMAIDMGWDFVGGMFTGGIMGGGSYAGSKAGQAVSNKLYQLAEKMYSGSDTTLGEEERIATSPSAPRNDSMEIENTAQTDGVRYSIRNTSQMTLKEQLSKFYGNKLKSSDAFYLGETPAVLEKAGAKAAPLVMTTSSFRKSVTDKHNVPRRVLNNLSENLRKPILSFGINGEVGVLINDIDGDGKPVLVGIHTDEVMDREAVNAVRSIYGLDNPSAWIQNQIDAGKHLEVYDEQKANKFLQTYGYQASVEGNVRSVTRITDPGANVKQNPSTSGGKVLLQGNQGHTFEVELGSVASAGDGKLVMNLQGGGSADVSNMSFPNTGMQLLYQTVAKIADSAETAQQLLDGIKFVEGSAQNYALGIGQVYLYGKLQMPLEEAVRSSNAVRQLDADLRNSIYEMGQRAGQKQTARLQQERQKAKTDGVNKKGQLHFDGDRNALTARQKVSLQACEVIAKALSVQVYVFESQRSESGRRVGDNGWYDPADGSIHIDLHAGNNSEGVMVFTLAHELTHFIRDWSPAKYDILAGFLAEQYGKTGQSIRDMVLLQQRKAEKSGRMLTFEQAHEEWVADSMETMLADGAILEKLSMLQAKDESLTQKIRQFLDKFLQKLKTAYKGMRPQTMEGEVTAEMVDAAQKLRDLFADALVDAGNNFRSAEKNTTGEGGVRFSVRDGNITAESTEQERYDLLKNAQLKLVNVKESAISHVDLEAYNTRKKSSVVSGFKELAKKLGILNLDLSNSKIDFPFRFSGRNLEISLHHQLEYGGTYQDYVKAMSCFNELVTNALPIEVHKEKKTGTPKENKDLLQTYVLISAYVDGNKIIPVQFEVKEFRERNNSLYMTVVLTKIDLEVMDTGVPGKTGNMPHLFSRSNITLQHIFENVNEKDGRFLKYVPDGFLSEEQKRAKKIALQKQEAEYAGYEKKKSARDQDGISPRELLLKTVEGMVANDAEWKQLQEYRKKIQELNATEEKVVRLNEELRKLWFMQDSYDKGMEGQLQGQEKMYTIQKSRNYDLIRNLEQQRAEAIRRLNQHDSQLINLEATKPIRDIVDRMKKAAFQKGFDKAKRYYGEKHQAREQEIRKFYQESRHAAVESHNRTEMRRKIRKEVEGLRSLLEKAPKDRRVKEELQEFVNDAIKAADLVFLENYNEHNMVRNGVGIDLRGNEQQLLQECKQLLDQLDQIREEQEGNEPPENSMHQKWDPDKALQRDAREEAVKRELSKKMAILRDAGVFEAEYKRINDVDAEQLIDSLLKSYEKLKDTETEYLQGAYQENIVKKLNEVKNNIGAKALRDMTLPELEQLHELYHAVTHVVRTANETFATDKARQISELGETVISQLETEGKELLPALKEKLKELGIANLKPETVFELIGSDTLQDLMQGLYKGEDTYAMDVEEARIFAQEQGKKYGRKNWNMEKVFSFAGTKITLGQAMSLYAYSKRKQAQGHLEGDGFTGSKKVRIKEAMGKIPVVKWFTQNPVKTHTVSKPMYDDLGKLLTPDQKKYVDAMQDYLTKAMGAKGNEVSDKLYGLKLFKEDAYFPLKTASEYHDEVLGATMGEAKLKNTGFTKEVQKGASNPIVLDDFESVWAAHVDKMSLYHGMTLPMEDFERVYNYHRTAQEVVTDAAGEVYKTKDVKTKETVKVHIQNRMGEAANKYITTLMQQINGGVRGDSTEKMFSGMVRNFKKTAVLGSLSVTVQQPTAFARAMAYLDAADVADWKNWLGKAGKPETTLVAEMYKYAPVALMKRIGGFDPGLGRTSQEYIFGNNGSVLAKLDDALGLGPEKADEMTWAYIWICTKRQIHRQNPDMSVRSEAFLKKAGDRFSQIIRSTQVYDSVLVKSQYMRSPNIFMKMATSFMNEPTTSLDMYVNATIKASRGKINKKTTARIYGSVFCSQIMAAAAAAFVYALRDDDEDETYWEKYISSFVGKGLENILPWYNVPFVKDVISAFEGYTVERSDMSVFVDIYQAWKKLQSDKASPWEKVESFAGSVLNLFGIPFKNVSRDVRGIYRSISTIWGTDEQLTTSAGLRVALMEGLIGQKASNPDQLAKAVKNNDATQILRIMARYSTEQAACTAVSNAVKANLLNNGITEKKALEFLQVYAGIEWEDAEKKIAGWKFKAAYPDSSLDADIGAKWQTELKDLGISLEAFTSYKDQTKDIEADKDKNGKTISGSKKEKVLAVIDSLPLNRKQKNALYLTAGYDEDELSKAPWN